MYDSGVAGRKQRASAYGCPIIGKKLNMYKKMSWEKLKKLQRDNCLKISPADRWDDAKSNPIDDIKAASEALSKHESFYMKSMRWLFGKQLQETKN